VEWTTVSLALFLEAGKTFPVFLFLMKIKKNTHLSFQFHARQITKLRARSLGFAAPKNGSVQLQLQNTLSVEAAFSTGFQLKPVKQTN
jgi:hypothetical protein